MPRKITQGKDAWLWTCGSCGRSSYTPTPRALRERRTDLGLSLRAFAKLVKISASHVGDMERGKKPPTPRYLQALAKVERRKGKAS